jgi:hypothetical protein
MGQWAQELASPVIIPMGPLSRIWLPGPGERGATSATITKKKNSRAK